MAGLAELRHRAGVSQGELGMAAGISQAAVSSIERGRSKTTSVEIAQRLVRALNSRGVQCSIDDIFPPEQDQAA